MKWSKYKIIMCNIFNQTQTQIKLNLTSRFISSGVVRENRAPSVTISTYLFGLVRCHQPLYKCPPGGPHAFYMTFLQYL